MRCELCNTTTRCSCKGGGCPKCNNNNATVTVMNELIKFGLDKTTIRLKMDFIKKHIGKIDSYSLYEYLSDAITEEEFNEAVAEYKPNVRIRASQSIYGVKVEGNTENPNKQCVYKKPGIWERCVYCNSIKKYMVGKECPMAKKDGEKPVSTVVENNESDTKI